MRIAAATFCLALATSAAAADVSVRLTLPKSETMFGLAVPLHGEIVNGHRAVEVAGSAAIEVEGAGEAPRLLSIGPRRTAIIDFGKETHGEGVRLRPREKVSFSIPVDSLVRHAELGV